MQNKISIINYEMGNLLSVAKKMKLLGVDFEIAATPEAVLAADKIVLPGVGHFGKAMENLKKLNLLDALNEAVLIKKTPVLGICLGMQLMTKFSEEGNVDGLGWFDAHVQRFKDIDTIKHKVPHTGWNQLSKKKENQLLKNIGAKEEFYFVHSYHVVCNEISDILTETNYAYTFTSAIQKDNIYGVQFHPEKSHAIGQTLMANFVNL